MNEQEIQTFVALVEQMRNAQREYFRGRMGGGFRPGQEV